MSVLSVPAHGGWRFPFCCIKKGHTVKVWSAIQDEVDMLREKREHKNLPGIAIPSDMEITGDLEACIKGADLLVLSVPSVFTRQTARKMKPYVADGQIIVMWQRELKRKL